MPPAPNSLAVIVLKEIPVACISIRSAVIDVARLDVSAWAGSSRAFVDRDRELACLHFFIALLEQILDLIATGFEKRSLKQRPNPEIDLTLAPARLPDEFFVFVARGSVFMFGAKINVIRVHRRRGLKTRELGREKSFAFTAVNRRLDTASDVEASDRHISDKIRGFKSIPDRQTGLAS